MKILIDADGCPVVKLTIKIAKEKQTQVIVLCDTSHVFEIEGIQTITVSKGADSVDYKITNMVQKGDIVVTQDYGLAAMVLAKNGLALSQNGLIYDENNIDALLLQRHTAKKIRMAGGRFKGSSKRTKEQDDDFAKTLYKMLS